ncbi:clathrin interactor EPSIN 3-like isoform X2 [Prosopis cineraria]|uniref:clathrin interactor EPSIN 3-like isoform X2 n=1 Tax=Prosopis cineraria TaxID=364024 RepID=UPI00240F7AB9|nr:clathrin interactor EPSIN 3-like isoform X2 [Prosopis cineraria]
MKKAIGQTVRDLKREVNKKVLKVPGIEQKVLDATSNEPWGPHGSLLADIAQATRNYHEYQMIMAVIWKRINDTGKNWRHVYKALTVLEYLVAHGSERVIDEIREHAYQISTLSDFQYIDSSGRDQGNNVRRKSQSLVLLVNDKEKIIEVRQKAAANRDKFRNTSTGGMYRPGSYSGGGGYGDRYDGDRYGSRDEDRYGYGYGREREYGYREDDRHSRDGDRYGRDNEERYSRDGYRDDEYQGRSPGADDYQRGSRSRSADMDRNYDDDGQHSSRVKAEDHSLEARLERKLSQQNVSAPPSYEEAVSESRSPIQSERDVEASTASVPRGFSPNVNDNIAQNSAHTGSSPHVSDNPTPATAAVGIATSANQEADSFDEFDPRGSVSAAPAASKNVEIDLLGSLSESFSSNTLALVPATPATTTPEANANGGSATPFAAAASGPNNINQPFEDPFGDSPFKAIPSMETAPNQPHTYQSFEISQSSGLNPENVSNFRFGDSFSAAPHSTPGATHPQSFSTSSQFLPQDLSAPQQETDILADILPPAPLSVMTSHPNTSTTVSQTSPPSFLSSTGQSAPESFSVPSSQLAPQGFSAATSQPGQQAFSVPSGHLVQQGFSAPTNQPVQSPFSAPASQHAQPFTTPTGQLPYQTFTAHTGQPVQHAFSSPSEQSMQPPFSAPGGQPAQSSGNLHGGFNSQVGSLTPQPPNISQSQNGHNGQISSESFLPQGSTAPIPSSMGSQAPTGQDSQSANYFLQQGGSNAQSPFGPASQYNSGNLVAQQGTAAPFGSSISNQPQSVPGGKPNDVLGSLFGSTGGNAPNASSYAVSSSGPIAVVPLQSNDKFETKSTVWADTLSRGLVNLNISGPKINPLADIGIDFDAINRKEKRMEKPAATTVTSTVTMGKAMGSGSGIGRAGASALRVPANPMMGSGVGMGMGMGNGPGVGMGMGAYGGMNPSMGMGMGIGMGMGMNMAMGQGVQMQPPTGIPPGSNIPGNYNSMMGPGGYTQQPYGGYR